MAQVGVRTVYSERTLHIWTYEEGLIVREAVRPRPAIVYCTTRRLIDLRVSVELKAYTFGYHMSIG